MVDLKPFEYGFGNEREVNSVSLFFWKSVELCDGEGHNSTI